MRRRAELSRTKGLVPRIRYTMSQRSLSGRHREGQRRSTCMRSAIWMRGLEICSSPDVEAICRAVWALLARTDTCLERRRGGFRSRAEARGFGSGRGEKRPHRGGRATASLQPRRLPRQGWIRRVLVRYVQAFFVQSAFTSLSNATPHIDERLARWLLMCHDRSDGDHMVSDP